MTLLSIRREVGEFRRRYKWMALCALVFFGILVGRALQLQLVEHGRYAGAARRNITRTKVLPATRGVISDTRGRVIATNRPSYNVLVTPQYLDPERGVARTEELMGLDITARADFERRLASVAPGRRSQQIEMFTDISRDLVAVLETHSAELRGVDVVAVPVRTYPFGSLGAHAIGFLNEVNADDLGRRSEQGYRSGDLIGRGGIESAWESYLRGRRGEHRALLGPAGATTRASRTSRAPVPGRNITLTLDMELMRIVERAFRAHPSGGAVLVDVHTGRVRALFSKPSYDLNQMSGGLAREAARELEENPFRPLIDKTIYDSYFPGSTFKPVTALAGLGEGIIGPDARVSCPGYYQLGNRRFRCSHAHGEVDLRAALVRSCNVYFYSLARQVGLDRLAGYARDFGLGVATGIGINTETGGFIPTRAWYDEHYENQFRMGFTLNEAIGQGNTRVTLLQLAMAYAAIANGGTLYVPQIVEQVSAPDGSFVDHFEPQVRRRLGAAREYLAYVVDGLLGVVNDPTGTAYDVRIEGGVLVAGKTGTAQVQRRASDQLRNRGTSALYGRDHAWFAGFAPAGEPRVAVVVIVEHGGGGGKTAAPIGIQILQDYLSSREG